jgi:hypothetical protein
MPVSKVQPAQTVTSDMNAINRRIDGILKEAREFRKEQKRQRKDQAGPHKAALDILLKDQPIILTRQEITLIEAGLELLINQAYEQINAIDDDLSLDRSTKDDCIAGVQEALSEQKAVLEKMTMHKQRLEEANAQE